MKNSKSARKNSISTKHKIQKSEVRIPQVTPKLLLHTCCADCALKSISAIREGNEFEGEIILYYDNSNIHPRTEWLARLEAVKKVAGDLGLKLIVGDWSPKKWFAAIRDGGVVEKTGLARCRKCWELRLSLTRDKAIEIGTGCFSSTLLSSKHMNRMMIEEIGGELENGKLKFMKFEVVENCNDVLENESPRSKLRGIFFVRSCAHDFGAFHPRSKLRGITATNNDAENCNRLSFYRQNYCGCVYSLKDRYEEKFSE
jgi:hypothetical protein